MEREFFDKLYIGFAFLTCLSAIWLRQLKNIIYLYPLKKPRIFISSTIFLLLIGITREGICNSSHYLVKSLLTMCITCFFQMYTTWIRTLNKVSLCYVKTLKIIINMTWDFIFDKIYKNFFKLDRITYFNI